MSLAINDHRTISVAVWVRGIGDEPRRGVLQGSYSRRITDPELAGRGFPESFSLHVEGTGANISPAVSETPWGVPAYELELSIDSNRGHLVRDNDEAEQVLAWWRDKAERARHAATAFERQQREEAESIRQSHAKVLAQRSEAEEYDRKREVNPCRHQHPARALLQCDQPLGHDAGSDLVQHSHTFRNTAAIWGPVGTTTWIEDKRPPRCNAASPTGAGHRCRKQRGHNGLHEAPDGRDLLRWSDEQLRRCGTLSQRMKYPCEGAVGHPDAHFCTFGGRVNFWTDSDPRERSM